MMALPKLFCECSVLHIMCLYPGLNPEHKSVYDQWKMNMLLAYIDVNDIDIICTKCTISMDAVCLEYSNEVNDK